MTHTTLGRSDQDGNVLLMVLFFLFVLAGLTFAMFHTTIGKNRETLNDVLASRVLYGAEAGLDYNAALLGADPLYAVADQENFGVDNASREYVGREQELTLSGDKRRTFRLRVQYLDGNTPVLFANRGDPSESWSRIRVSSTSSIRGVEREVVAWYAFRMKSTFSGAIISDSTSTGVSGLGQKAQAQTGDVVFAEDIGSNNQYLFGDIKANGGVKHYSVDGKSSTVTELDGDNANGLFGATDTTVEPNLSGTADEVPDLTTIGSDQQLFDFDRFYAASAAGAGQVYTTVDDFVTAVEAANSAGEPLEGIIVLDLDSAAEGSKPTLDMADGINVHGTLLFRFSDGTDPLYKIVISTALNINAADLSAWDPADETTYTSGYPPTYDDPTKAPWAVDISPTYQNFSSSDDFPAMMFNTGIVDIHGDANISGVIYGPSFIEIENKSTSQTQYFNGAIIGGAGVLVDNTKGGIQGVHFDDRTLNQLATDGNKGKSLFRTGMSLR